jgi:hypothetical protein
MVTTSDLPLVWLVTRTLVPMGRVLWAAVAPWLHSRWPLAVLVPRLVAMEYQDALPCSVDLTAYCGSAVFLDVAFPMVAQLGRRMTPAIARATDLVFRVRFIVFVSGSIPRRQPLGSKLRKRLEMRMQGQIARSGFRKK